MPLPIAILLAAVIAILASLGGCSGGAGEAPPAQAFMEVDSAGVPIFITPGSEAFSPLDWELDSVPELVLGREEDPSGPFVRVVGVKLLPEGDFLVLDGGRRELMRFDVDGGERARRGGTGEGPGEFHSPTLVSAWGSDSVVVWDANQARVSVFSPDLAEVRVEILGNDPDGGRVGPQGVIGGHWLRRRQTANGGALWEAMLTEGPYEMVSELFVHDSLAGSDVTLATRSAVTGYHSARHGPRMPGGNFRILVLPHPPVLRWAVVADELLFSAGRSYEIRQVDLHGRVGRILRVDAVPGPVTRETIEGWLRRTRRLPPGTRVDPADVEVFFEYPYPIPETLPAFVSLLADATGQEVWAELYERAAEDQARWVVFAPEGRALGTITTPVGFEVHAIGEDRVLGVWRSHLGEEFVHAYRLRRTDG
jgi:hypothetical protein